jgi:hypothetical protein
MPPVPGTGETNNEERSEVDPAVTNQKKYQNEKEIIGRRITKRTLRVFLRPHVQTDERTDDEPFILHDRSLHLLGVVVQDFHTVAKIIEH